MLEVWQIALSTKAAVSILGMFRLTGYPAVFHNLVPNPAELLNSAGIATVYFTVSITVSDRECHKIWLAPNRSIN